MNNGAFATTLSAALVSCLLNAKQTKTSSFVRLLWKCREIGRLTFPQRGTWIEFWCTGRHSKLPPPLSKPTWVAKTWTSQVNVIQRGKSCGWIGPSLRARRRRAHWPESPHLTLSPWILPDSSWLSYTVGQCDTPPPSVVKEYDIPWSALFLLIGPHLIIWKGSSTISNVQLFSNQCSVCTLGGAFQNSWFKNPFVSYLFTLYRCSFTNVARSFVCKKH